MFKLLSKFFVKAAGSFPEEYHPENSPSALANNEEAVLQGDLSVVTIENLMQLMSHAGLSGELHLITSDNEASFVIRKGALVFGHLTNSSPRMGERLVQAGYITNENLLECLHVYQEQSSKQKLGRILVDNRYISVAHLEEIIREQVKDCFFKVLSWKKGSFFFFSNESPPEEDILLDERIDHLILEGIFEMDDNIPLSN